MTELVARWATTRPDRIAYTWLADGERVEQELRFAELHRRVQAVAATLAAAGPGAGDRVLVMHPPGPELVVALLGVQAAAMVPVLVPAPTSPATTQRLQMIVEDARPSLALVPAVDDDTASISLPRLATEALDVDAALDHRGSPPAATDVALLQYTSGTTHRPRGVVVTHAALLANQRHISRAFGHDESMVMVSWLPPHHDMGLVGGVLNPLFLGARCVLMPPSAFLRRPARWLEAITRHRGTTSGGPDFAFRLCIDRVGDEELEALELSSWRVAFDGAEPIRARTLRDFARRFGPRGFDPAAWLPCYGLAEATLLVAGERTSEPVAPLPCDADALERGRLQPTATGSGRTVERVGCALAPEAPVLVADEHGRALPEGEIGRVLVRGPATARGYFGDAARSEGVFGCHAEGRSDWLDTGDMGAIHEGSLYLLGRSRELIIVRGHNHYPHELEDAVRHAVPELATAKLVAWTADDEHQTQVWIGVEDRPSMRPLPELAAQVRAAVATSLGITPHGVARLPRGAIPTTTSGKLRRTELARRWAAGTLEVLEQDAPTRDPLTGLEGLRAAAAGVLGCEPTDWPPDLPLTAWGLDSLRALELQHVLEQRAGARVPLRDLLSLPLRSLAARLSTLAPASPSAPSLDAPMPERVPLSVGQRVQWLQTRTSTGPEVLNLVGALRLHGPLDVPSLEVALRFVARRHGALRTVIEHDGDEPHQRTLPEARFPLRRDTLPAEGLQALLAQEQRQPFELARGPLVRAVLAREHEHQHVLVLTVHHMLMDLASLVPLVRDLFETQAALQRGEPPPEAPPSNVHAAHAMAQARWLQTDAALAERAWWRARLEGWREPLERLGRRPTAATHRFDGRSVAFALPPAVVEALQERARSLGITLPIALMSSFAAMLARVCGRARATVGWVTGLRDRPETRDAIGYFVNLLPIRFDLGDDPDLATFAVTLRDEILEALDHATLPFPERIGATGELRPHHTLDASFCFQDAPGLDEAGLAPLAMGVAGDLPEVGQLRLASLEVPIGVSHYALSLFAARHRGGVIARLDYQREAFDHATVEGMSAIVCRLVHALAAGETRPVWRVPLREPILPPPPAVAPDDDIGALFLRQAAARPEAPALLFGDEVTSYGELSRRACQLAHALGARGIAPGDHVGLLLPRSPDAVAAIFAILLAGAAYVPLDPTYPRDRLRFMLEDADVRVLVCDPAAASQTLGDVEGLVLVDPRDPDHRRLPEHPPASAAEVGPQTAAYLVYTSGSTGTPNGVIGLHAGVTHRQRDIWQRFPWRDGEVGSLKTSLSFFDSGGEMFCPLLAGYPVAIIDEQTGKDPQALVDALERHRVTRVVLVPSLLAAILDAHDDLDRRLARLRYCHCSGESLPGALIDRAHDALPRCTLVNLYGSSEISADATLYVPPRRPGEPEPRPDLIGRPMLGVEVHVVDARLEPLPPGIPGEIVVGGVGLARGYHRRPELTATKFVPSPFGPDPAARLFRTGDRGRFTADGELEYLGRLDAQVKIRGIRVELGEVEAALASDPRVAHACVTTDTGTGEDDGLRIVAGLVPEASALAPPAEPSEHDAELVEDWQRLYDQAYREAEQPGRAAVNIWSDSHTGEPFSPAEMEQWRRGAIDRIRELRPARVLELGTGTGELLLALAPACERYVATDLSRSSIEVVRAALHARPELAARVELHHRRADDLRGLDLPDFDLVVLHSVVQYFPSLGYLWAVLDELVPRLAVGARIFIGDLRVLELQEVFRLGVVEHAGPGPIDAAERLRRARRRVELDEELVLGRGWYRALAQRYPQVTGIDVRRKPGAIANEITRFRHDVIVYTGDEADPGDAEARHATVRWPGEDELLAAVHRDRPEAILVASIPDARLVGPVDHHRRVVAAAAQGRRHPEPATPGGAAEVDVDALVQRLASAGYRAWVGPAREGGLEHVDLAAFRDRPPPSLLRAWRRPRDGTGPIASDPSRARRERALLAAVRSRLRTRLPEFMVPSHFELFDALPRTPSGKVDRLRLREAVSVARPAARAAPPAATGLAATIEAVWREVLGLERVSPHENFFDLGGNSLSLARVHVRLQQRLGRSLPLLSLYEHPTVHALAEALGEAPEPPAASPPPEPPDERADARAAIRATRRRRMGR